MTATITQEVAATAAGVAAEIRERGHWQGQMDDRSAKCCIVVNKTWHGLKSSAAKEFAYAIALEAGFPFDYERDSLDPIFAWNDTTPTDEVLAVLDRLAGV